MYDAICIGNTQHTLNKIKNDHIQSPTSPQKRTKIRFISAHFKQKFNNNASRADLRKYMTFKLAKTLNPIGAMETFTKPNFNLFMEERLAILKIYVTNASRV